MESTLPIYKTYDELPLIFSVPTLAAVLGISRASAYELAHRKNFPSMLIGCRIIVPKDRLFAWIEEQLSANK